jgi:hypothetical protein
MNTITKVNEAIQRFQLLFASKKDRKNNDKLIASLLNNAKYINFGKVKFDNLDTNEKLRMYLAYENNLLYGVLLKESEDLNSNSNDVKYYVSTFSSQNLVINNNLPSSTNPNAISYATLDQRIKAWEKDYYNWMTTNLDLGFLVQYFEIDASNFSETSDNKGVFGLIPTAEANYPKQLNYTNAVAIDFAIVNDGGYMDMVRPVPPFKP